MPRITADTIPGIHVKKTPSGKVYYRHRKTQEPIKFPYPSAEFDAEVARLNALVAAKEKPASEATPPGSLDALIQAWRNSPEFAALMPRTRADYLKLLDYLKPAAPRAILSGFTRGDVLRVRDMAHKAHKFHFANYLVTVMSVLFKWAVEREMMSFNPAAAIKPIPRPKHMPTRNRRWTEAEREIVLAEATGGMRVAIALGIWAAPREQDVLAMTWECVGKDGKLRWTMQKTGDRHAPWQIHPRLAAILDEARSGDVVPLPSAHLVVGGRSGRPYTEDGFRKVFFDLIRRLEREGKIGPGLTFHGLRHTMGATLATRNASTTMIRVALGHRTEEMARHYSKEFNESSLADDACNLLDNGVHPVKDSGDGREESNEEFLKK